MKSAIILYAIASGTIALLPVSVRAAEPKKCIHVASYEKDYSWTADIDSSLRTELTNVCNVETIYMEAKKNPTEEYGAKKALEIKSVIEATKPNLVIVSDDPAVKHLLAEHFKDAALPFVFVGVNWSIEPYKLPYKNATGVIEVAPIEAMIYELRKSQSHVKTIAMIGPDNNATQAKEFPEVQKRFESAGFKVLMYAANTFVDWKKSFVDANEQADFVYVGNFKGTKGWVDAEAKDWALKHTKKLSAGTNEWLIDVAAIVMAKRPDEQGKLGGERAKLILEGRSPASVYPTTNKLYTSLINKELLAKTGAKLSDGLMRSAK